VSEFRVYYIGQTWFSGLAFGALLIGGEAPPIGFWEPNFSKFFNLGNLGTERLALIQTKFFFC
jgi:hypothetical protein